MDNIETHSPVCSVCKTPLGAEIRVFQCLCDLLTCSCAASCPRCRVSTFYDGDLRTPLNTLFYENQLKIWNTTTHHIASLIGFSLKSKIVAVVRRFLIQDVQHNEEWGAYVQTPTDFYDLQILMHPSRRYKPLDVELHLTAEGQEFLKKRGGIYERGRVYPAPSIEKLGPCVYDTCCCTKSQLVSSFVLNRGALASLNTNYSGYATYCPQEESLLPDLPVEVPKPKTRRGRKPRRRD